MFVGREQELASLCKIIESREPKIAVIYGRRRIGKTSLIRRAIGKEEALFIEGLEGQTTQRQIRTFIMQVNHQMKMKLPECSSWEEALLSLSQALKKRRMVIVLDEFQWLANYRTELVTTLKMVWDTVLSKVPGRTLILCGSIASFMTTRVIRSSAFYGRTDLILELQGFRLAETALLLKKRGFQEVLDAQCLTGGVPKYLETLAAHSSISLGMEEEAFRKDGYFVEEYDRIFTSHFGKGSEYARLVRCLADQPYGGYRKELAAAAGIQEGGMLSQKLYDLEAAGFISSVTPFDKEEGSRLIRYYLSDPWMSFYHSFLRTRLKKLQAKRSDLFQALRQTGLFRSWMGRAFELVCIRHHVELAEVLGFSAVDYTAGPWFRSASKDLDGVQIDLAYSRADGVITLCEMKRQTAPVGVSVVAEVERKVNLLRAVYPRLTVQPVLVYDGAVTKDLQSSGYFYRLVSAQDLMR